MPTPPCRSRLMQSLARTSSNIRYWQGAVTTLTNQHLSLPVKLTVLARRTDVRLFRLVCLLLAGLIGTADAAGLCPGEMQRAMKMRQRIIREWPLRPSSDPVSEYIQKLGVSLAERFGAGTHAIPWRFTAVRNLAPNAFSIGAGNVFVNEGAITFAQNEAELAAILSHEIAHELAGHFCDEGRASTSSGGLFDIFSAPESRHYITDIGSMTQTINPAKELQADQIALSILQASGYDPRAMLNVARRLPLGGAVHLLDTSRIQSLDQAVANLPPLRSGNSEEFLKIKQLLSGE